MRSTTSRLVALCGSLFLVAAITTPVTHADPTRTSATAPTVELVTQTPTVVSGGTFELWLRLDEVPADGSVELVLFGRVRSRSELAASMESNQLRSQIYNVTMPIASLPVEADGTRRVSLSLDPVAVGGLALTSAGVYPVAIEARDASGASLSRLITHLLVRPDPTDESPPLAVAVLTSFDAPPALQPDGDIRLDEASLRQATELVAALASTPRAAATIAIRPEMIDALRLSGVPAHAALIDQLRLVAAGRPVVSLPYVDASPDVLVAANLTDELDDDLTRGRRVLADALGVDPSPHTWLAGPDLDLPGLRAIQRLGVEHLIVASDHVKPLRSGVLSLSLAQPFLIRGDTTPAVDAIALDPAVIDRIGTSLSTGLEVSRVLAELAVLWFEQPGVARSVVLPVDASVRGPVVAGLLQGLGAGGLFRATTLDDLFATASPLRQPGGGRVDRALVADDARPLPRALANSVRASRKLLSSVMGMLGPDSPRADAGAAHLLLATSSDLDRADHQAHLEAAQTIMGGLTGAIQAPQPKTITLTARDGTVPLTLHNDAGIPVKVLVQLRSPKLEFPNGETISITLTDPTTRLNISVRARASGTFPLEILVTSPDGALTLATVDYSVQSTAVSGVGLVLSVGAAIFLLVWWARHWRRTRRSAKLVPSSHPPDVASADAVVTGTDGAPSR